MRRLIPVGFVVVFSVSSCATMRASSPSIPPSGAPPAASTANSGSEIQPQSQSQGESAASPSPPDTAGSDSAVSNEPSGAQSAPAAPSGSSAASARPTKPKSPVDNPPAKHTATGLPAVPPAAPPATSTKTPPAPTLDLADLEQRLRDTHAIGVLTKLSLKNQVDDLLAQFRAFYKGANKRPTPELRQRYDLLLLKVLSLLQDSDPDLAAAISSSREAIWGILADPDKFAKI